MHTAYWIVDGFDVSKLSRDDVRLAFVLTLPFRLRVGSLYRSSFVSGEHRIDLWLRNSVQLAGKPDGLHKILASGSYEELWTETAIVIENPRVDDNTVEALREQSCVDDGAPVVRLGHEFGAMQALNHFIVAYGTATRQVFGGRPLERLRVMDFLTRLRWVVAILGPTERLTEENGRQLFELQPSRSIRSMGQLTGDLHDLPASALAGIDETLARSADLIFYELAFEAKARMATQDYVGALVMAVAALEAAHSALVAQAFSERVPGKSQQLASEFIRELGMTLCSKTTPYLLLDERERPPADLIRKSVTGVRYRNAIMHSVRNRRGQYRARAYTNKELTEAYAAVLQIYEHYRSALERRVQQSSSAAIEAHRP